MSQKRKYDIEVPAMIAADENAVELARIWFTDNEPVMVLKPAFAHPRHFGMVLADTVRHLARVYASEKGMDQAQAFDEICQGLQGRLEANDPGSDIEAMPVGRA